MKIRGDTITVYSLLTDAPPEDISVERPPGGPTKAFNFNVDVTLHIDLAKITGANSILSDQLQT